ncbi:MAG: NTP transferase domain-containing protein [Ignavibacteriaceae bacterium]|jgi:bifunctional UDP-N-acetylglucosamine pyrophosphorylase/glucosamine-1-phosphate N-acetyltransferase|nr:NTP transferase domain-containing protein [Ignavibacteriaceae bacterium]GIK21647.1 MAG: bifunctional protein GlmU [Ignavibacteriota bacterium]
MSENLSKEVYLRAKQDSTKFNNTKEVAVILAAGHGKRIKSQTSKMLHRIWEITTVERVYNACKLGIDNINSVVVVGIKALDVMDVIGKRESNKFAYQEMQNGTGHAVQVALKEVANEFKDGIVYVLPGDMGLLDDESMKKFRNDFISSKKDMMVLTGIYNGDPMLNSYGRIIRTKEGNSDGNVIQIMEFKDILALPDDRPYEVTYRNKKYSYTKKELIETNEFNSGVYAFDYKKLVELINHISSNNAQNEIYITDLIELFNKKGYTVGAVSPKEQYVVMGFNDKSVLKEMDEIARRNVYEKLKNIIQIDDPDDFFIHDSVVNDLLEMDKKGIPLDIKIDKGAYVGDGVKLNYNVEIGRAAYINGNVVFGKNIKIWRIVHLSTFPHQTLTIEDNVKILWGDIIKGNIIIGENSTIESSVNMTGSDEFPLRIGKNVLIKGTSYLFGSVIEDDVTIEHSVLIKKKVKAEKDKDGKIKPVKFFIPDIEGKELLSDI